MLSSVGPGQLGIAQAGPLSGPPLNEHPPTGGGAPRSSVSHPPSATVAAPIANREVPAWNARELIDSGATVEVRTNAALEGAAASLVIDVEFEGGTDTLSAGVGPAACGDGSDAVFGSRGGSETGTRFSFGSGASEADGGRSTAVVLILPDVAVEPISDL